MIRWVLLFVVAYNQDPIRVRPTPEADYNRSKLLAELPTIQEQGVEFGNLSAWTGIFAPKGTPPEVIETLSAALRDLLEEPAVRQRLAEIGFEVQWLNSKDFAKFVAAENEQWAVLTKEAGIERQ